MRFLSSIGAMLFAIGAAHAQAPAFIRGADLSSLYRLEEAGAEFRAGSERASALDILRDEGMNLVRLRLWHTPEGGVNGLEETLAMAQRIRALGLAFLLDVHYSDTWADPGRQTKPAAWVGLSYDVLRDSVYQYTHDVVAALKAQGTLPEMVQLGNETVQGMLWPEGRLNGDDAVQWERFANLLKSARQGLLDALEPHDEVEIMIHIDRGGNLSTSRWYFDHLLAQGLEFDVIGQSFYPWWHGTLAALENNLNRLAAIYDKDLVVVEFAYPFTLDWNDNTDNPVGAPNHAHAGYPVTRVGQQTYLTDLRTIVESVPDGRGRGYVYWEPAWIAWEGSAGSPWENVGLFDFSERLIRPSASAIFAAAGTTIDPTRPVPDGSVSEIQVYPLPARERATLEFSLGRAGTVQISIHDVLGREVLVPHRSHLGTGRHRVDLAVADLRAGLYTYRLTVDSGTARFGTFVVVD